MNSLFLILLIIIVSYIVVTDTTPIKKIETFNEQNGQFCITCREKTLNQCMKCFNCGFCIDRKGNAACIGGDHRGPYNFERCAYWYHTDPYSRMIQQNVNYKCSYGPSNYSRTIRDR